MFDEAGPVEGADVHPRAVEPARRFVRRGWALDDEEALERPEGIPRTPRNWLPSAQPQLSTSREAMEIPSPLEGLSLTAQEVID